MWACFQWSWNKFWANYLGPTHLQLVLFIPGLGPLLHKKYNRNMPSMEDTFYMRLFMLKMLLVIRRSRIFSRITLIFTEAYTELRIDANNLASERRNQDCYNYTTFDKQEDNLNYRD